MLTLYRRHLSNCQHKSKGRQFKRCRCPIWIQGTVEGKPVRKSLDVASWDRAEEIKNEIEHGKEKPQQEITVAAALASFMREREDSNLSPNVLGKYRRLASRLGAFAEAKGIDRCDGFTPDLVRDFKGTWHLAPRTASKEVERLRGLFNFFVESGWIEKSPAKSIKAPEVRPNPTLPFTDGEVARILEASDFRSAVFFRVLLNSGLRISDAAALTPEKVQNGKLFLYAAKTGNPVYVPLPPDLIEDLERIPLVGGFYFMVECETPYVIAEYYRRKLIKVCKQSGIKNPKPHRFRDTFATNLLVRGVPIETVAMLLANTVRVCEKHYSPWVRARQDALEVAVMGTWKEPKLKLVK